MLHNLSEAPYGRILILYNPSLISLNPVHSFDQLIQCHAHNLHYNTSFYISFIYASNFLMSRLPLLKTIHSLTQSSHPWLILGDFNCCYDSSQRYGGNPSSLTEIRPLKETIESSELIPIKCSGMPFSWNNKKRQGPRTFTLIDHAFSNSKSFSYWLAMYCHMPPLILSDHSPILLHLTELDMKGKASFKIFNSWVHKPDFLELVKGGWERPPFGNTLVILQTKIMNIKHVLRDWAKMKYGNGSKQTTY